MAGPVSGHGGSHINPSQYLSGLQSRAMASMNGGNSYRGEYARSGHGTVQQFSQPVIEQEPPKKAGFFGKLRATVKGFVKSPAKMLGGLKDMVLHPGKNWKAWAMFGGAILLTAAGFGPLVLAIGASMSAEAMLKGAALTYAGWKADDLALIEEGAAVTGTGAIGLGLSAVPLAKSLRIKNTAQNVVKNPAAYAGKNGVKFGGRNFTPDEVATMLPDDVAAMLSRGDAVRLAGRQQLNAMTSRFGSMKGFFSNTRNAVTNPGSLFDKISFKGNQILPQIPRSLDDARTEVRFQIDQFRTGNGNRFANVTGDGTKFGNARNRMTTSLDDFKTTIKNRAPFEADPVLRMLKSRKQVGEQLDAFLKRNNVSSVDELSGPAKTRGEWMQRRITKLEDDLLEQHKIDTRFRNPAELDGQINVRTAEIQGNIDHLNNLRSQLDEAIETGDDAAVKRLTDEVATAESNVGSLMDVPLYSRAMLPLKVWESQNPGFFRTQFVIQGDKQFDVDKYYQDVMNNMGQTNYTQYA